MQIPGLCVCVGCVQGGGGDLGPTGMGVDELLIMDVTAMYGKQVPVVKGNQSSFEWRS